MRQDAGWPKAQMETPSHTSPSVADYCRQRDTGAQPRLIVLEDGREQKKARQVGSTSSVDTSAVGNFWSQIWKIDCIPKVKQFIWRFAHNSLPLRMNIVRRGMEIDTRCPMCWRLDEDGGHCFLKCKLVKKCWQHLNLEDVRVHLLTLSAKEVVRHTHILRLNRDKQQLIICLLWSWWMGRNKANVGE